MRRHVHASIHLTVTEQADLVWSVAVDKTVPLESESLSITVDGQEIGVEEVLDITTRLHRTRHTPVGELVLEYDAVVSAEVPAMGTYPIDEIRYLRPSRYVGSDTLAPVANARFKGMAGKELLDAIVLWVNQELTYVSGSSRPTDGAVHTYLAREGVCRDFAHLSIAMLRAVGVPARLVSVYAPGLVPPDFHAVAEALVDGVWQVVDATTMAPRTSLLRIATGRDASDTAFLSVLSGRTTLGAMKVDAVAEPGLPVDDTTMLTQLR